METLLLGGIASITTIIMTILIYLLYRHNKSDEFRTLSEFEITNENRTNQAQVMNEDLFCYALRCSVLKSLASKGEQVVELGLPFGQTRIQSYCLTEFATIRSLCSIKKHRLMSSLRLPMEQCFHDSRKGKSVFMMTGCGNYLFKTLRGKEPQNLMSIVDDYQRHLEIYRDSLMPRYLGLYHFQLSSTLPLGTDIDHTRAYFIVLMKNWFDPHCQPQLKFDFKGSSVGRFTNIDFESKSDLFDTSLSKITLKELDFLHLVKRNVINPIIIDKHSKEILQNQLLKDVMFLEKGDFMDYSLVIGIYKFKNMHHISLDIDNGSQLHSFLGGLEALDGKSVFTFGLVDCLQRFSLRKRCEKIWKSMRFTFNSNQIEYFEYPLDSVEHPKPYAHRLLEFANKVIVGYYCNVCPTNKRVKHA